VIGCPLVNGQGLTFERYLHDVLLRKIAWQSREKRSRIFLTKKGLSGFLLGGIAWLFLFVLSAIFFLRMKVIIHFFS
jgi:hypothetical protein